MLSTASSVASETNCGQSAEYGLFPSLLGVNKQIKLETESILYDSNVFYAALVDSRNSYRHTGCGGAVLTRLTRYFYTKYTDTLSLSENTAIGLVRHWKAVISLYHSDDALPNSMDEFCRVLSRSRPESLELAIIPQSFKDGFISGNRHLADVLRPLEMLRSVAKVCIRDAKLREIPNIMQKADREIEGEIESCLFQQEEYTNGLILLMKSDSPTELAFEMYPPLLRYAQAFENNHLFEENMENPDHTPLYCNDCGYWGYHLTPFESSRNIP
jgi:hypothetical protein